IGDVEHTERLAVQVGDEQVVALLVDAEAIAIAGQVVVADQAQVALLGARVDLFDGQRSVVLLYHPVLFPPSPSVAPPPAAGTAPRRCRRARPRARPAAGPARPPSLRTSRTGRAAAACRCPASPCRRRRSQSPRAAPAARTPPCRPTGGGCRRSAAAAAPVRGRRTACRAARSCTPGGPARSGTRRRCARPRSSASGSARARRASPADRE